MTTHVQEIFDSIAKRYDLGNAILSLGLHRKWNQRLIAAALHASPEGPILDLCAGTGAIGLGYLKQSPQSLAYLLDFSPEMLTIATQRAQESGVHSRFQPLVANAQNIPLPDRSIHAVTTAYGIRNIGDPIQCACEVKRILKPSGTWAILELTRPPSRCLHFLHSLYLKTALPLIGGLLSGNWHAYSYLARSIHEFTAPEQLAGQISQVGFCVEKLTPFCGGIATLIVLKEAT